MPRASQPAARSASSAAVSIVPVGLDGLSTIRPSRRTDAARRARARLSDLEMDHIRAGRRQAIGGAHHIHHDEGRDLPATGKLQGHRRYFATWNTIPPLRGSRAALQLSDAFFRPSGQIIALTHSAPPRLPASPPPPPTHPPPANPSCR